jgi:hypothetical protein
MDNDDVILDNCIEILLGLAQKYPEAEIINGAHLSIADTDFVHPTFANIISQNIQKHYEQENVLGKISCINFFLSRRIFKGIAVLGVWATLYKNDFIEKNKISFSQDLPVTEDVWFRYQCFKHATQAVLEFVPIYIYRQRDDSYSNHKKEQYQRKECWAICLEKMMQDIDDNEAYSKHLINWCSTYAQLWLNELNTEKEKTLTPRYLEISKKINSYIS